MDGILTDIIKLFPHINSYFMAGFLIFTRLLGFFRFAPIFCRKELPSLVKLAIAILITVMIIPLFDPKMVLEKVDSPIYA